MSKPLVVFTYAPTGLGHIRVTNALRDGIPDNFNSLIFSPNDPSIEYIHRLGSLNVVARHIMEWFQGGSPQRVFTYLYRKFLKSNPENIFSELTSLIKSLNSSPSRIIIVATHFGLAYQIGMLKPLLEKEFKVDIKLVVQITDDSPQYIWYVDVADLIIAPSQYTVDELQKYGRSAKLKPVKFLVVDYPVSPCLAKQLAPDQITQRLDQYNPQSNSPINIMIPISGAAVGTNFFIKLTEKLHKLSSRYFFHIVCRQAPFTDNFIINIRTKKYLNLYTAESYQNTVDLYDNIYQKNVIAAEITKPSEQAFKALLTNDSIGGSFLFFATPIGRQEYDNLNYLHRNDLLSPYGRGVLLPYGSHNVAKFIHQFFINGTLYNNFKILQKTKNQEVDTVSDFWQAIIKEYQL